jgi:LTXXQ motif family protein
MIKVSYIINTALAFALALSSAYTAPALAQGEELAPSVQLMHKALNLDAMQEAAWQAYRAQALAPEAAQARRAQAAKLFPKLPSPQRMDLVESEVKLELADVQRQSQVLKAFYDTLTPGQKQIFDLMTLPPANEQ